MVVALLGLVATLAAFFGAGTLVQAALQDRRTHLMAWAASGVFLGLALAATTLGLFAGFGPFTFRTLQITGALLAPVCLAIGLIELISQVVQVRFATRLIGISYSLVAVVVLAADPLTGTFGKKVPQAGDHYNFLPAGLVNGAHVLAIIALVAGAVITALRANGDDAGDALELLLPAAIATGAGVAIVGAVGYLPGILKIIGMAVAAGLVWFAAVRTQARDDEGEDVEPDRPPRRDPRDTGAMRQEPPMPPRGRPMPQRPPQNTGAQQGPPPPYGTGAQPVPNGQVPGQGGPVVGDDWFAPPPPVQRPPGGPYGQIVVYTLLDGREQAFDRQAADLVRASTQAESGILIYTFHEVEGAPTQRISYQLFRDRAAFADHQGRPHVTRFQAESRTHVLATNVIDLKLTGGNLPILR